MSALTLANKSPQLAFSDQIDRIKNKSAFSLIFPLGILAIIIVIFGIATGGDFFRSSVLLGIFNQALIIGTMATAVSFIYTTGNLDISIGSIMALGATIGAIVYNFTGNVIMMLLVAFVVGLTLMMFNYTMSITFKIPSMMVAIVMIQLYGSIVSEILGPNALKVDYKMCVLLENNGFRYITFIVYFVVCLVVYHFTPVGRQLRFIGGNKNCALQVGIGSKRAVLISYIMAGIGVGIAATFTIIRTGSIGLTTGSGMGMDVMLATVLGGMSIYGGAKSNSYSGIIGALTVATLNKGLVMVGVSPTMVQGVRGTIFLLLVFLNSVRPDTLPSKQQV